MPGSIVRASEVVPRPISWVWRDRIQRGNLSVLDGDPGTNKTSLTCDFAARLTLGRSPYGSDESLPPATVLMIQGEDSVSEMRARLLACGADLNRALIYDKTTGPLSFPDDVAWLDAVVHEHNVLLVVIDPIFDFLTSNAQSEFGVRRALHPLNAMAERRGCAVLLLRHLTKSGNRNPLYRGTGSIGLIATVRQGWIVAADPANPERRILAQTKPRFNTTVESLCFRPFTNQHGLAIEWTGTSRLSASDLLVAEDRNAFAVEEAMVFLVALLSQGPMPQRQVYTLAAREGHSVKTLYRARAALGVRWDHVGYGPGSCSLLRLPENAEEVARLRERIVDPPERDGWHDDEQVFGDDEPTFDDEGPVPHVDDNPSGANVPPAASGPNTVDIPVAPPLSADWPPHRAIIRRRQVPDNPPPSPEASPQNGAR